MDLISQLPEDLLHEILLKLATKDSVRTSVLSTRWRYLWQRVPGLDIFIYNELKGFVNRFLDLDKKSLIKQLKLEFIDTKSETEGSNFINKWVNSVVARGVQHLVVIAFVMDFENMNMINHCHLKLPASISMCETLVHLKLVEVGIHSFDSVSLPRLVTMHLKSVWFSSDAALERLISSSPVLQDLSIEEIWNVELLRVRSQTLNSLSIDIWKTNLNKHGQIIGLAIDAPRLKRLSLELDQIIDLVLNSVSKVKNLNLSCSSLKSMCAYSRLQPLPAFSNLTHLKVDIFYGNEVLELLPTFLASCPNLKSLQLSICIYIDKVDSSRSHVPKCLLTSLEIVEISISAANDQVETELVKYILGNAAILKELNLKFNFSGDKQRLQFVEQIFALPKRSSACQVFVHPS